MFYSNLNFRQATSRNGNQLNLGQ